MWLEAGRKCFRAEVFGRIFPVIPDLRTALTIVRASSLKFLSEQELGQFNLSDSRGRAGLSAKWWPDFLTAAFAGSSATAVSGPAGAGAKRRGELAGMNLDPADVAEDLISLLKSLGRPRAQLGLSHPSVQRHDHHVARAVEISI